MKFGKTENIKGRWKFIELEDSEVEKALDELLEHNLKVMSKIKVNVDSAQLPSLLEKQMTNSFTYLSYKVDKKASDMNDEPSKPINDYNKPIVNQEEVEKKVNEQMSKPPENMSGKSLIAQAFETAK